MKNKTNLIDDEIKRSNIYAPVGAQTKIFANDGYIIPVAEGCKIWMPSKKICLEIEKKLNGFGVQTRSGCACGTDLWSIYIISVPENLINIEVLSC